MDHLGFIIRCGDLIKNLLKKSGWICLFALAYFLIGKLSLTLATIDLSVSPVWPVSGLAIALLFLGGRKFWPAILLGAFLVNCTTGNSFYAALIIALGNMAEALCGAYILNLVLLNKEKFDPYTKTIAIVLASVLSASVSATIGSATLAMEHHYGWKKFVAIWLTWWTGDTLGGVIYIPLVLAFCKNKFNEYIIIRPKILSVLGILLSASLLCYLLFIRTGGVSFLFFIFPLLLWCVNVLGSKGASLMTVFISVFGILSVGMGYGVFNHGSINSNLVNLQLFLASVGICAMIMADLKKFSSFKQPAIILLFSWLLAGIFFAGFNIKTARDSDNHFDLLIDGVEPMVDARLKLYFSALRSGNDLFAASENVTKNEWQTFLQVGHVSHDLPGITGMGVIFRVPKKELDKFIVKIRKTEISDFNYHLYSGGESFAKKNTDAYIVTYIGPMASNAKKLGLDMASESIRKTAADQATDLAEPAISGRVHLIDDPSRRPAFLAFSPLYKNGSVPASIPERRANIMGWIYSPIYADDFFSSVFTLGNLKEISFAVYEKIGNKMELMTSSSDFFELPDTGKEIREMTIGNHLFYFHFKRSPVFFSSQDNFASWTGAITSIISLLLGAFIISLQSVKKRALDFANQATKELKASEELWKFALQGAGDGVWDMYVAYDIIKFTNDFKEVLGYTAKTLGDRFEDWEKLVHPEDLPKLRWMFHKEFGDKKSFNDEYRLMCHSGEYRWYNARGSIVSQDESGNPLRMVGTITDISDRKTAEHELENQKEKLYSIFEGSSDALMLLNADGGFFDCNRQALKLFGLKNKDEILAMTPSFLSAPVQPGGMESIRKAQLEINKAFREGINRFEWTHRKVSGETFPADVLLTSFSYDGKQVIQACVRDITEKKMIDAALAAQRDILVASAKMSSLGEMAGGIAHEINNPLAIILGKTTQLKRRLNLQSQINSNKNDISLEQLIDGLSTIETTSKRIGAIIKGLSAFSRNAENDSMEKVLVPALIQDTLELSKERFKFHSINLKYDLSACEKTYVLGKTSQLLQVLVNLLNNAFDAVEFLPQKWVDIDTQIVGETCRILITDSGPGIAPEVIEKLMTPFFTTKSVGKGTGLGLSISKGIIEEHKGKLFYDQSCKNTRFIIELPIVQNT